MADRAPCIYVLAGTNGAGKSSIAGATFRALGAGFFDPDEAARRILNANPDITQQLANSLAWNEGKRLLERAIAERLDYAFETTLGGSTIARLLELAIESGFDVRIWYVGLSSPEQHIARVHARVRRGGHDIPQERIRERYHRSRLNLVRLMPRLTGMRLYDNSVEADPHQGLTPQPRLLLHLVEGKIVRICRPSTAPEWAKPLLAAASRLE